MLLIHSIIDFWILYTFLQSWLAKLRGLKLYKFSYSSDRTVQRIKKIYKKCLKVGRISNLYIDERKFNSIAYTRKKILYHQSLICIRYLTHESVRMEGFLSIYKYKYIQYARAYITRINKCDMEKNKKAVYVFVQWERVPNTTTICFYK